MSVRAATAADLPALLAVLAELHPDDPPPPDPLAVWRAIEAQPGRTVLVAVHGAAVVGTVDCAVLPNLTRGGRPFMQVENVVVAAAARRAGVGRALLTSALAMAREAGCYKVQLLSRIDREAAHALYADSGFRPTAAGYRAYL